MVSIAFSLVAIVAVFLTIFFIALVLFKVLAYVPTNPDINPSEYLYTVAYTLIYFLIIAFGFLLDGIIFLTSTLASNWKLLLGAVVISVASEIIIQYGPQILQEFDQGTTEFGEPIYKLYVINVTNVLRVTYRSIICWINLINSIGTIIVQSFISISYHCVAQDWTATINLAVVAFESIFISIGNFLLSFGANDLDVFTPVQALTTFTRSFQNVFICQCDTISFATTYILETINDPSFGETLNGALNAYIEFYRQILNTFKQFFLNGFDFFNCGNVSPDSARINCLYTRPPTFDKIGTDACEGVEGLFRFVDALIRNAIYIWVPDTFPVPRTAPFLGNVTCAFLLEYANLYNVYFHADLLFPLPGYPSDTHYLSHVNFQLPTDHGRLAAGGVGIFWTDMRNGITDEIGCITSSSLNITVNIADAIQRFMVQLTVDPLNIINYIADGNLPVTDIEANVDKIGACTAALAANLNADLGSWVLQMNNVISKLSIIYINLIPQLPNFFTYISSVGFRTDIVNYLSASDGMGIATGNIVRQADLNGPGSCPNIDPIFGQNILLHPPIQDIELFCCIGSMLDMDVRFVISLFRYILLTIIDLVDCSGSCFTTVFGPGGDGNLDTDVIPKLKYLLDSSACILPSFFDFLNNGGICPTGGPATLQSAFYLWFKTILEILLIPPQFLAQIIVYIVDVIDGSPPDICTIFNELYNLTLGNVAVVFKGFCVALDCIAPGGVFLDFGNFVYTMFGPDGEFITGLCNVLTIFIEVTTLVVNFFLHPETFFENLYTEFGAYIDALFAQLIQPIETIINDINTEITNLSNDISGAFTCINDAINQFFGDLAGCIGSCFVSGCGSCGFSIACNIRRSYSSDMNNLFSYNVDDIGSPCYVQIMASRNESYGPDISRILKRDAAECISSDAYARMIDRTLLLQFNNTQKRLVDPMAFYDPSVQMKTLFNISVFLKYFTKYEMGFLMGTIDYTGSVVPNQSVYYAEPWQQFAIKNGITDPLSLRVGNIIDAMFYTMKNSQSKTGNPLLVSIGNLFYYIWKFAIGIWATPGAVSVPVITARRVINDIPIAMNALYNVSVGMKSSSGYKAISKMVEKNIGVAYESTIEWLKNKTLTNDPRLIKNRMGGLVLYDKVRVAIDREKRNFGYSVDEPTDSYLYNRTNGEIFIPRYAQDFMTHDMRERDISLCLFGECINCTLLEQVLDKVVNLIFLCINDSASFIDVNANFSVAGNAIPKQPKPAFSKPASLAPFTYFADNSPTTNIATASVWLLSQITFNKVDFAYVADFTGYFFSNGNSSDENSWRFWVDFFTHCDYQNGPRCQVNPSGLGIYPAIGIVLLIYFGLVLAVGFFTPFGQQAAIGLLPFLIPAMVSTGYFISPWCEIPKYPIPIGLLPNCMADDLFLGLYSLEAECIQWQTFLPNLTTVPCPTALENYQRPFPDWKREPYMFNSGLRNIFFFFEWQIPSVNEFLRTTNILLFSWIRNVQYFDQYLTFDFSNGSIQQDPSWTTYFYVTILAVFPVTVVFLALVIGLIAVTYPVFLLLISLLTILIAGTLLLVSFIFAVFVYGQNNKGFYRDTSSFDFLYAKK